MATENITIIQRFESPELFSSGNTKIVASYIMQVDEQDTNDNESWNDKISNDFVDDFDSGMSEDPDELYSESIVKTTLYLGELNPTGSTGQVYLQFDYYDPERKNILFDNLVVQNLNRDETKDFYIDVIKESSDFNKAAEQFFFIQNPETGAFSLLEKHFPKEQVRFIQDHVIEVKNSVSPFSTYYSEDSSLNAMFFPSFYEFQGTELVEVNRKYKHIYQTLQHQSSIKVRERLRQIASYTVNTEDLGQSQYEMNQYFQEVINHKIIIEKCQQVLD